MVITATFITDVDCSPSFFQRAVESVIEDIAQREQSHEVAALVNHDEAVHARFADCIEDCVQTVVQGASVDAGEILRCECQLKRPRALS